MILFCETERTVAQVAAKCSVVLFGLSNGLIDGADRKFRDKNYVHNFGYKDLIETVD